MAKTSWWFQPIWKIWSSKWESSPNRCENKQWLKPPSRFVFVARRTKKTFQFGWISSWWFDVFVLRMGFWKTVPSKHIPPTIIIKTSGCDQHLLMCEAPEKNNSFRKLSLVDLLGSFFIFKNVDSAKILTLNSQTIFKVSKTVNKLKSNMIFITIPIYTSQKLVNKTTLTFSAPTNWCLKNLWNRGKFFPFSSGKNVRWDVWG